MQKIPIRKLFEKGRNSLDLKNFVEETKFIASDRGEAVELFKLNILLVPKLPCGQKEAQQIAGAGRTFPGFSSGNVLSSWLLLSFWLFLVPHALLPSYWLPALLLVPPCPFPGGIMGDCLSYGDCQVYLTLSICDHRRGSARARQWSHGQQFAVGASWQQLCRRLSTALAAQMLPFSSVRTPFADQPTSYGVWLQIWP